MWLFCFFCLDWCLKTAETCFKSKEGDNLITTFPLQSSFKHNYNDVCRVIHCSSYRASWNRTQKHWLKGSFNSQKLLNGRLGFNNFDLSYQLVIPLLPSCVCFYLNKACISITSATILLVYLITSDSQQVRKIHPSKGWFSPGAIYHLAETKSNTARMKEGAINNSFVNKG